MATVLVLPVLFDASQCRIYAHHMDLPNALACYRESDGAGWREVGLMDWYGKVRCIEPEFARLREDEPLMAGTQYHFPKE